MKSPSAFVASGFFGCMRIVMPKLDARIKSGLRIQRLLPEDDLGSV